jgi:hypothetical protein
VLEVFVLASATAPPLAATEQVCVKMTEKVRTPAQDRGAFR